MIPRRKRVLLMAETDARAARIEAALRDAPDLDVAVARSSAFAHRIEEHEPDVVVLASSNARVASTLASIAGALHAPPIILLADDPRAAWTSGARRAGVQAVLPQDAPIHQLTAAIDATTAGLIALHPDAFRTAVRSTVGDASEEDALTAREREILGMIAEGLSNRVIARRLGISNYTVKSHVASILGKLRAKSRTGAVTLGVRGGLISL